MAHERDKHTYSRAVVKSSGAVTKLKTVLKLSHSTKLNVFIVPKFLKYCQRTDIWRNEFVVQKNAALHVLINLDRTVEFSSFL